MLLYGQLQEGLTYTLMESPAVSGAQDYNRATALPEIKYIL